LNILRDDNAEFHIETAAENRDAVISLAEQARYRLNIFTQDLDAAVFDNTVFETCIFNLARKHQSSNIRILVKDSGIAAKQGHCMIRLAQQLTSSVFIHNPDREHMGEIATFMVVDGTGFIHRPRSSSRNYDAVVNFSSPRRAAELDDFFDAMWERSTPDSLIRRLYI